MIDSWSDESSGLLRFEATIDSPAPSVAYTLQWHHNEGDSVSNHQPHDCLLNRLFERTSKKTSNLCVTGLCAGNSPGTGEFPAQTASNAENVSIWWRHHVCVSDLGQHYFRYWLFPYSGNYLDQCWSVVDTNLRNKFKWNIKRNSYTSIEENTFENVVCEMATILSRSQWVNVAV